IADYHGTVHFYVAKKEGRGSRRKRTVAADCTQTRATGAESAVAALGNNAGATRKHAQGDAARSLHPTTADSVSLAARGNHASAAGAAGVVVAACGGHARAV